jgi:phosphoglycolate phosphatase
LTIDSAILDLDGTIVAFNLDYKALRAEVKGYLMKNGIPASVLSLSESIFELLKKAKLQMSNFGRSSIFIEQVSQHIFDLAEKYELEAAASTSLFPGVLGTLNTLKQDKIKIGLCTLNGEKATNFILNRFKIRDYFDAVVAREKASSLKPHPGHFEAVLKALNAETLGTVIVGDSISDMQGAKELKVIAIGLPTGVSTKENLVSHGANYIISKRINKTSSSKT